MLNRFLASRKSSEHFLAIFGTLHRVSNARRRSVQKSSSGQLSKSKTAPNDEYLQAVRWRERRTTTEEFREHFLSRTLVYFFLYVFATLWFSKLKMVSILKAPFRFGFRWFLPDISFYANIERIYLLSHFVWKITKCSELSRANQEMIVLSCAGTTNRSWFSFYCRVVDYIFERYLVRTLLPCREQPWKRSPAF